MKKITDLGKIGITLAGEYDGNAAYEKLTIVMRNGKSYISKKEVKGVAPETDISQKNWQLVAEAKDAYHMLVDTGKTTLTEEEFLEQLVDATKGRYIVQGNVINAADEEDLTVEHSSLLGIDTLKLADRPSTKGMGYVILRKNKTFAEQVTKENTIYEIRYNFDLEGESITLSDNCILQFEGGVLSNGTLIGVNTCIKANIEQIFEDINISGTWNVVEAYPEWFGAKGDGINDDTLVIQKTINYFDRISFLDKTYLVNTLDSNNVCITIPQNRIIIGHRYGHIAEHERQTIKCTNSNVKTIFLLNGHCEIKDISFGLPSSGTTVNDPISSYNAAIRSIFTYDIKLYNVKTDGGDIGFDINSFMSQIIGCHSYHNKIGFYVHGNLNNNEVPTVQQTTVYMANCYSIISRINGYRIIGLSYSNFSCLAADGCGHDLLQPVNSWSNVHAPYYFAYCNDCNLINSGAESSLKFIKTLSCKRTLKIENCNFAYGYHTNDMLGGTYTPGHLYEIMYGGTDIDGITLTYGGVDPDTLRNAVTNNSPLLYIEGNASDYIVSQIRNTEGYGNISTGGYVNKDKNILVEYNKKWENHRSLSSGTLTDLLNTIPFYYCKQEVTNITIDANNRESGTYIAQTINLHGNTIVIRKGTNNIITFYAQNHPITFVNGKVIFIGLILTSSGFTGNTTYVFKLDKCDVEFYNCKFEFTSVQAILQAVQGYEFAKLVNTTYGDRTLITNDNKVEISTNI